MRERARGGAGIGAHAKADERGAIGQGRHVGVTGRSTARRHSSLLNRLRGVTVKARGPPSAAVYSEAARGILGT